MAVRGLQLASALTLAMCLGAGTSRAQPPAPAAQEPAHDMHDMHDMSGMDASSWLVMQDGEVNLIANRQGGPRGGTDWPVTNWWMGMASRSSGRHSFTFTGMFSLDAATAGKDGYRELFQIGESLDGRPLVDRQHPHDLFMQLGAAWTFRAGDRTQLTVVGGPVGEPAIGPAAFMHRASASAIPFAPLSHHTFDSTHIAFGVATVSLERGRWTVESSLFNGREPDDSRWDFDFGPLDSAAARVWFRPAPAWEMQVSTAHLVEPEPLEPGNVQRTTASISWLRERDGRVSALTAGYGVNAADHGRRQAVFGEISHTLPYVTLSSRFEVLQLETNRLTGADDVDAAPSDPLAALTLAFLRDLRGPSHLAVSAGAALTTYVVPAALAATHSTNPLSAQVFVKIRPRAGSMGRMWNMRMSKPMTAAVHEH
jgi:hypothetical protein